MEEVYKGYTVFGPYSRKDKRQIVILIKDKIRKTISYPKYLYEKENNIYLKDNETIHHIDGNFLNNSFSNLEILDRSEHSKQDSKKLRIEFNCSSCREKITLINKKAYIKLSNFKRKKNKKMYCSRSCAGKLGKEDICLKTIYYK